MEKNNIQQRITKKGFFQIIGALLLGALGSGAWEYIVKPFFRGSSNVILNIITLGTTSLKNNIYIEVSQSFHNAESLQLLTTFLSIFIGIFIVCSFFSIKRLKMIRTNNKNNSYVTTNNKDIWFFRIFIIFSISSSLIYFTSSYKALYVNKAITHYKQLQTMCIPYIDNSEIQMLDSQFSQIQNEKDYLVIIKNLEKIANKNNLKYNSFNSV